MIAYARPSSVVPAAQHGSGGIPAFTFVLVFIVSSSLNPRLPTDVNTPICRTKSLCSLSVCPRQNQLSNLSLSSLPFSFPF